jgi:hypothetical protein
MRLKMNGLFIGFAATVHGCIHGAKGVYTLKVHAPETKGYFRTNYYSDRVIDFSQYGVRLRSINKKSTSPTGVKQSDKGRSVLPGLLIAALVIFSFGYGVPILLRSEGGWSQPFTR